MILSLCVFLSIFSCNGGGGGDSKEQISFKLNSYEVSPSQISRSSNDYVVFTWKVNSNHLPYYMDIYVSDDDKIDDSDTRIIHYRTDKLDDSYILPSQNLSSVLGGPHFIIFDAYYNDVHSIKYVSNVIFKTKWTVIVYMDGDNSLCTEIDNDLNEISKIGSSKDVNVVVQTDSNSDTTKRYFILQNENRLLADLGELNMAEPDTLIDFVTWAVDNYPAEHYLLVLWDHGTGFKSIRAKRDIFEDDTSNGVAMSIPDLGYSLAKIKEHIGKKIDIVGMDACLMGMVEIAYEIKDYADFMVASENTEPFAGWPYDAILSYLIKDKEGNITSYDLSKKIVELFVSSYTSSDEATLSAIDLSKMDSLIDSLSDFTGDLINGVQGDPALKNALKTTIYNGVQKFDDGGDEFGIDLNDSYVDLYHLIYLIQDSFPSYFTKAQDVLSAIQNAMISSGVSTDSEDSNPPSILGNVHGLSIWYPDPENWDADNLEYLQLQFTLDTRWDTLITTIWDL
ncbi:hypothetical protein JCM13304A_14530 [Desulfothermus okinawensis JCM 13304]